MNNTPNLKNGYL